jgi:hypothetical protein
MKPTRTAWLLVPALLVLSVSAAIALTYSIRSPRGLALTGLE